MAYENIYLAPLKGLQGQSKEFIDKWKTDNAEKLKVLGDENADFWYKAQYLKDTYGKEFFKSTKGATFEESKKNVNDAYRSSIIWDAWNKRFNPYDDEQILHKDKGLGEQFDYLTKTFDEEGMLELLESEYKTPNEIEEELKYIKGQRGKAIDERELDFGGRIRAGIARIVTPKAMSDSKYNSLNPKYREKIAKERDELSGKIVDFLGIADNFVANTQALSDQALKSVIYNNDKRNLVNPARPQVDEYMHYMRDNVSDEDTEKQFEEFIDVNGDLGGIPTAYSFYYGKDNNKETVEEEMQNFTVDHMRDILSQKAIYEQQGVPDSKIREIIENEFKDWVNDKRSNTTKALLFSKDVGVAATVYAAQKAQTAMDIGLAGLDAATDGVEVYKTADGEVVPTSQVIAYPNGVDGVYKRTNEKGEVETIKVKKVSTTRLALNQEGKDADGNDRSFFLNKKIMSKAERYNTLDEEMIKQFDKSGVSVYSPTWGATGTENIWYSAGKMSSFPIMDQLLPWGLGKLTKPLGLVGKGLRATILNPTAAGLVSAGAIGNAYGIGVYDETLQKNKENLDSSIQNMALENVENAIKGNESILKDRIYQEKEAMIKELMAYYGPENQERVREELSRNTGYYEQKAKRRAYSSLIDEEINKLKQSDAYFYGMNEAQNNASMAANNAALLTGIKYGIINTYGYRKFLFRTPEQGLSSLARETTGSFLKDVKKFGGDVFKGKYGDAKAKSLQLGKSAWSQVVLGGALTNFTDDMQSDAAEYIAGQAFNKYLNNYEDGKYLDSYSEVSGNLLGMINGDYLKGAIGSLSQETTWRAGLVGGMGSVLPLNSVPVLAYNIAMPSAEMKKMMKESGAKNRFSLMKDSRYLAAMTQYGILNDYYANKEKTQQLQAAYDASKEVMGKPEMTNAVKNILKARALSQSQDTEDKKNGKILEAVALLDGLVRFDKEEHSEAKDLDAEGVANFNEFVMQSEQMQSLLNQWNNIITDNLSDAEKEELIKEYYAANPSVVRSKETNALALRTIKENAQSIMDACNKMLEAEETIAEFEKKQGKKKKIDGIAKQKLIENHILKNDIDNRLQEYESDISTRDISTIEERNIEQDIISLGNKGDVLGNYNKALQLEYYETSKALDKGNEELSKLQAEADRTTANLENTRKKANQEEVADATKEFNEAHSKLYLAKKNVAQLEKHKESLQEKMTSFEDYDNSLNEETPVSLNKDGNINEKTLNNKKNRKLNAERFFGFKVNLNSKKSISKAEHFLRNLNPYTRARLFKTIAEYKRNKAKNPNAESPFDDKMTSILETIYDNMIEKDPSIVDKIIGVSKLLGQQSILERDIKEAFENPDAYIYKQGKLQENAEDLAYQLFIQRSADGILEDLNLKTKILNKMFSDSKEGKISKKDIAEAKRNMIKQNLLQYKSDLILSALLQRNTPFINKYRDAILETKDVLDAFDSVRKNVENKAIERGLTKEEVKSEVDGVRGVLTSIADKTENLNRENFMKSLKEFSESPTADDKIVKIASDAYDYLSQIDNQKHSTVDEETIKNNRKERDEKRKKAKEEYENKLKEESEKEKARREKEAKEAAEKKKKEEAKNVKSVYRIGDIEVVEKNDGSMDFFALVNGERTKKNKASLVVPIEQINNANSLYTADDITGLRFYSYNGEENGEYTYDADIFLKNGEIKSEKLHFKSPIHEKILEELRAKEAAKEVAKEATENKEEKKEDNKEEKKDSKDKDDRTINTDNTGITLGEEVNLGLTESFTPSVDEVTKEEYIDSTKIKETVSTAESNDTVETVKEEDNEVKDSNTEYIGNPLFRYDFNSLKEDGYLVPRKGASEGDKLNQFFDWMDANGIKYQEIIDTELADIIAIANEVKFVLIAPNKNNPYNAVMQKEVLTVVKYTDEIAKIHHEEYGGVIETNDGKYLIIGAVGYGKSGEMANTAHEFKDKLKANRTNHLKNNPNTEFYVEPSMSTKVTGITPGYIVRKLASDSAVEYRSISQLLKEKERNPDGLDFEDLKWGIQKNGIFKPIGLEGLEYRKPIDELANVGNVFMMVRSGNGIYIPVLMRTISYSQMKEGLLKREIMNALTELTSPIFKDRQRAAKKLMEIFYFDKNDKTILYGNEDINVLTIVDNGNKGRTFDLKDPAFNRMDFFDAVMDLDPIINLTSSVLSNPSLLKMYDAAGVLLTDVAKLGTSGSHYYISAVDANGKVYENTTVELPNNGSKSSELSKVKYESVVIGKDVYRYKKDRWVDAFDNPITDVKLLTTIQYNYAIEHNKMAPIYESSSVELYMFNSDPNKLEIVSRNKTTKNIRVLSQEEAKRQLEGIEKVKEAKRLEEEAKKRLEELRQIQEEEDRLISRDASGIDYTLDEAPMELGLMDDTVSTTDKENTESKEEKSKKESEKKEERKEDKKEIKEEPKTLEDYRKASSQAPTSLQEAITNLNTGKALRDLLRAKAKAAGLKLSTVTDMANFVKSKGIITENIKDYDSWVEEIKNCF